MTPRRVGDIDYLLLPGTERKTADIVIERDGQVVVRPPAGLSDEQVDELVASKRFWIYRNLAEWRDLNATAVIREWVNGEAFLCLSLGQLFERRQIIFPLEVYDGDPKSHRLRRSS